MYFFLNQTRSLIHWHVKNIFTVLYLYEKPPVLYDLIFYFFTFSTMFVENLSVIFTDKWMWFGFSPHLFPCFSSIFTMIGEVSIYPIMYGFLSFSSFNIKQVYSKEASKYFHSLYWCYYVKYWTDCYLTRLMAWLEVHRGSG